MRSFIIASVILAATVAAVIFSSIYITRSSEELISECDKLLSGSPETSAEDLSNKWDKNKKLLYITVNKRTVEKADEAVSAVLLNRNSRNEFMICLEELKSALRSVRESGRLSCESLF